MRVRIHRGAEEIGGNCVEVEAASARLVLDLGRPLWADFDYDVPLPRIPGLEEDAENPIEGIVVSHPHLDHFGLLSKVDQRVPVYIGEAAHRIISVASKYVPGLPEMAPKDFLKHRKVLEIGPFRVTPYLVDHSAYDSYALLVEADGKKLFYSGDLRSHGRKGRLFESMVESPPVGVDVLLLEGTHVPPPGRPERQSRSEDDVESEFVRLLRDTDGMLLVAYSGQNIDRLVSLCRAAIKTDRLLVLDLYGAMIARATGNERIPQADWDVVRVFVPEHLRRKIRAEGDFKDINSIRASRIFPENLKQLRQKMVMTVRSSYVADLEKAKCLDGAQAVWSMWNGYLETPSGTRFKEFLRKNGISLHKVHASGHATVHDLGCLVEAFASARVVPIHSFGGDRFGELFPRVERHHDGEWWDV